MSNVENAIQTITDLAIIGYVEIGCKTIKESFVTLPQAAMACRMAAESVNDDVVEWANLVGIIKHVSKHDQMQKVWEELNEFDKAVLDEPEINQKLEYGDLLIALTNLGEILNLDQNECIRLALEKNKARGGVLKNGNYVKN
jgi:uncharacterized protein YabN with tetrapyrrole methylase and pyrophosphatase domain